MKIHDLPLAGLKLIELDVHRDDRGFFTERFNVQKFQEHSLPCNFVQDNFSRSLPGVIRALHFQHDPGQGKLIGVTRGKIWDAVVDIRENSPTYGQYFAVELDGSQPHMLWIPQGFAHGFCVLGSEPADVLYKIDALYNSNGESGIAWNDPELQIPWPEKNPLISKRDQGLPSFAEYKKKPLFKFETLPRQK